LGGGVPGDGHFEFGAVVKNSVGNWCSNRRVDSGESRGKRPGESVENGKVCKFCAVASRSTLLFARSTHLKASDNL
jgi:hypothetical protein